MDLITGRVMSDISSSPWRRFLQNVDNYYHKIGLRNRGQHHDPIFYPTFDIGELPNSYKLSGELPGVQKQDVKIEFTGPRSIHIDGTTYASHTYDSSSSRSDIGDHEAAQKRQDGSTVNQVESSITQSEPTTSLDHQGIAKFWSAEKGVGRFSRTFSFPTEIQKAGSRASLKDGILSIQPELNLIFLFVP
ncbi:hypothetical protein VHEMI05866 [[Torrubiella] hemipterigena]|uniref:SHSP domain-containing protein n=1 Tax=[Torrubiella] hemipterigena TaxID=1531966 RepID=A0A0A1TI13_9HYPO|nr:hypothetical protein VHEMI05866 [[Torrubiella] hemipterigena]